LGFCQTFVLQGLLTTRLTRVTGPFNKGAPLYPSHGKAQAV